MDWETLIGGKGAAVVGGLGILFAAAFFVNYAFQQGWVNPGLRIALGVLCGFGMIGGSEAARAKRMASYAESLAATGLGLLFVSLYAGMVYYRLYSPMATGAGLMATAALGVWLALRADSQRLALLSALGAYLTPLLISGDTGGHAFSLVFLEYLAVVSAGLAALAFARSWRTIHAFAFIATWRFAWDSLTDTLHGVFAAQFAFATIFLLIFISASVALRRRVKRPASETDSALRAPEGVDLALLLLNPILWFAAVREMIRGGMDAQVWMTVLAFALAAGYGALAAAPRRRRDSLLEGAALAVSVSFFTTGLAYALPSRMTLAWSLEAVVLLAWGFRRRNPLVRYAAHMVMALAVTRLFTHDLGVAPPASALPFLNARFLALLFVAGTLTAFAGFYRRYGRAERDIGFLWAWTGALALLAVGAALESTVYLTVLWGLLALGWALTTRATGYRALRGQLFALMVVLVAFSLFEGTAFQVAGAIPLFNVRFVSLMALAGLMVAGAVLFPAPETNERSGATPLTATALYLLGAHLTLLYGLSVEFLALLDRTLPHATPYAVAQSARQFTLSALWAGYGGLLVAWGFARNGSAARQAGLALLGVVVVKLLLVDMASVETIWRIASFFGVGLLLLLVAWGYNRRGGGS